MPVEGGIVIALSRLNRVLHVDLENQRMTVQPGVTNLDITRQVAADGYYFRTMVHQIVKSLPFQARRGEDVTVTGGLR